MKPIKIITHNDFIYVAFSLLNPSGKYFSYVLETTCF
jgi:hypothetical protein